MMDDPASNYSALERHAAVASVKDCYSGSRAY